MKDSRFTISFTGHRHIVQRDWPIMKDRIKERLMKFPVNSEVLTGLANGADQLMASICLEQHLPYRVIMPMSKEEFLQKSILTELDPKTPSKLRKERNDRFDHLIKNALEVIPIYDQNWFKHEYNQNSFGVEISALPYVLLGKYLIENSDSLIALWNGSDNLKPGGTADIIKQAISSRNAGPTQYEIWYLNTPTTDQSAIQNKAYDWYKA